MIRKPVYKGGIDFCPPNGKKLVGLPYFLKKHNIETIMWTLEPEIYYPNAEDKMNYVLENIQPGSIILVHPMYSQPSEAIQVIEDILRELKNEGYTFVTVDELQE